MRIHPAFSGFALAIAALTAFAANDSAQAVVGGPCRTPMLNYISSNQTNATTTSTTFVNMPNTNVSFTQSVDGCVVVNLTFGATSNSLSDDLRVRAVIDGITIKGLPTEATILSYNGATVQFIFQNVPAGPHTLNMQFRSNSGSDVFVSRTLTVVNYR